MLDGNQEVCSRPICREKVVDLQRHLVYREAARERSERGFCGVPGCRAARSGQCSKCGALYCDRHLHDRDEIIHRGLVKFSRPASFCEHCLARRRLWSKQ